MTKTLKTSVPAATLVAIAGALAHERTLGQFNPDTAPEIVDAAAQVQADVMAQDPSAYGWIEGKDADGKHLAVKTPKGARRVEFDRSFKAQDTSDLRRPVEDVDLAALFGEPVGA